MVRLRRSNTTGRGYHRVRSGKGFSFRDFAGETVGDRELRTRFAALGIPPAWTDVWICPHDNGHVQATGVDDAGRRQYIYHPAWRERQDRVKFERALLLAAALPSARAVVTRTLRSNGDPHLRTLAAAFRMLDTGSLRVGSERYAEAHGSHGLSTLLCSHVSVSKDRIRLSFPAKSGQQWESEIEDADLAAYVRTRLRAADDAPLLSWRDGRELRPVTAAEINEYVRERTGGEFTAKDFRTLSGSIAAATSLAVTGPETGQRAQSRAVRFAMECAAERLGNTPAIARKSYVDPRIIDLYSAGETIDAQSGASPEAELRKLLSRDSPLA